MRAPGVIGKTTGPGSTVHNVRMTLTFRGQDAVCTLLHTRTSALSSHPIYSALPSDGVTAACDPRLSVAENYHEMMTEAGGWR